VICGNVPLLEVAGNGVRAGDDLTPRAGLRRGRMLDGLGVGLRSNVSFRAHGDGVAVDVSDPLNVAITWEQLDLGLD
jgi:hypothetical protein